MVNTQTTREIRSILEEAIGQTVTKFQVLAVNSLKSVAPTPEQTLGATITEVSADERNVTIGLGAFIISIDLQRTGRVLWLPRAVPAKIGDRAQPTIRLLFNSNSGLDFTEPAKTKRISVHLTTRNTA